MARRLRAEGHEVHAPSLTGLGDRAHLLGPHVDLHLHARDIAALIVAEDLRDVILVGHSYGGMVITGAADLVTDRVGRLVFLDAANPVNGQSLLDVAGPIIEAVRPFGEIRRRSRAGPAAGPRRRAPLRRRRSRRPGLDGGAPHARIRGSASSNPSTCRTRTALWAIPQYHVVCTSTLATRDPEMMARAKAGGRLWDIDTGHDLMITEPEATTQALLEVAAA